MLEAGASGLEEREDAAGGCLLVYAPAEHVEAVAAAAAACAPGAALAGPEPVVEQNWADLWKRGLEPVEVSPRLRVRPSFLPSPPARGQAELVIDPGQAFGTGGHASTLLALEWVARVVPDLPADVRVLDVGCGTGVLALAALELGAARALAFDVDPLAGAAAHANARANGLERRLDVYVGGVAALGPSLFDLVLANLLKSELLPTLEELVMHTAFGGRVVLSGLLSADRDEVVEAARSLGLELLEGSERDDGSGDLWVSLLMRR